MIYQEKSLVRRGLQHDAVFPKEARDSSDELGSMVQAIAGAFHSQIGILWETSLDRSTPRILAAAGLPNPDFALLVATAGWSRELSRLSSYQSGRIGNVDFSEFVISADEQDEDYCFLQMSAIGEGEKVFTLWIGRLHGDGPYSVGEKDGMRNFFSILSRYFISLWEQSAFGNPLRKLVSALDLWNIGIALIDPQLRIIYSNSFADSILDEGDGLKKTGHNLGASRLADMARLQSAVLFSIQESSENGITAVYPKAPIIAIARSGRRRPLIVSVVPIDAINQESSQSAVVYIIDPERDMRNGIEAICRTYGLTNVEAQLAGNLVRGMTVQQAAQKMHIQPHTARSYLKQIFQKTMTNRQADLVRVMLVSALHHANKVDLSVM